MTKQATIDTHLHADGAVSHKITFGDGSTDLVLIPSTSPLAQQFLAHGSRAKIQAAVNSANEKFTAAERVAALSKAFEEGRWTMNEVSDRPKGTALVRALAALKGCPVADAEAYVKALSRAEQAKLRAVPAVAAKIIALEAEDRSEAGGDLLDGFLGGGEDAEQTGSSDERAAA